MMIHEADICRVHQEAEKKWTAGDYVMAAAIWAGWIAFLIAAFTRI